MVCEHQMLQSCSSSSAPLSVQLCWACEPATMPPPLLAAPTPSAFLRQLVGILSALANLLVETVLLVLTISLQLKTSFLQLFILIPSLSCTKKHQHLLLAYHYD